MAAPILRLRAHLVPDHAYLVVLVGLPEAFQALKLIALVHVWYVGVVQAAPLGLKAEDLQQERPYTHQQPQCTLPYQLGHPWAQHTQEWWIDAGPCSIVRKRSTALALLSALQSG